jgi:hypothetical protein
MKKLSAATLSLALLCSAAHARSPSEGSELSVIGTVSVIGGSMMIVASPFIIVGNILEAAGNSQRVNVNVTTDKGRTETIQLPKEVVAQSKIRQGDKLSVTPKASGALLSKNDKPVVFLVTPENATLTRSHELAK